MLTWNAFRRRFAGSGCSMAQMGEKWRQYKQNSDAPGLFAPCRPPSFTAARGETPPDTEPVVAPPGVEPTAAPPEARLSALPPELLAEMAFRARTPQIARSLCLASRAGLQHCRANEDIMAQLVHRHFPHFAEIVLERRHPFDAFMWLTAVPLFENIEREVHRPGGYVTFRVYVPDRRYWSQFAVWRDTGMQVDRILVPMLTGVISLGSGSIADVLRAALYRDGNLRSSLRIYIRQKLAGATEDPRRISSVVTGRPISEWPAVPRL